MKKPEVKFYSVRDSYDTFCVAAVSLSAARAEARRSNPNDDDLENLVVKETTVRTAKECYGYRDFIESGLEGEKTFWLGAVGTAGMEPPLCCM